MVSLGLIADPQHADLDDQPLFYPAKRRFRQVLELVAVAVHSFNAAGVRAVVQLVSRNLPTCVHAYAWQGDLIDGGNVKLGESETALQRLTWVAAAIDDSIARMRKLPHGPFEVEAPPGTNV